jgi:hypothetical protein
MKTIRRLAILGLFGLTTTTAFAGPPPENNKPTAYEPAYNAPTIFTISDLNTLLKAGYENVQKTGEGQDTCFLLNDVPFKSKTTLKVYNWSVSMNLRQRAGRQSYVRVYFPCQRIPTNASSERLQELMEMGGVMTDSPAYFVIGGKGNDRMLYLVTDFSTLELSAAKLKEDINRLFEAAHETSHLWGAKLAVQTTKNDAKEVKNDLVGTWTFHKKSKENYPEPYIEGLTSINFAKDGACNLGISSGGPFHSRFNKEDATYTIDGNKITICHSQGKKTETHTFVVKDGMLIITPEKEQEDNLVVRATTFYLWE